MSILDTVKKSQKSLPTHGSLVPTRLRCEAMHNPLAVECAQPRLSWQVLSSERDAEQSAFQIIVASRPEWLDDQHADLWNSGKIESRQTIDVPYAGKTIPCATRAYWSVRVWDAHGHSSRYSTPAVFGQGPGADGWVAQWIGMDSARDVELPPAPFGRAKWIWHAADNRRNAQGTRYFMGTLTLPEDIKIAHAELLLTATGAYSFYWSVEQFARGAGGPGSYRNVYHRTMTERLHGGENRFYLCVNATPNEAAGVIFRVLVRDESGKEYEMVSDQQWRSTATIAAGVIWHDPKDVSDWRHVREIAPYGAEPWGELRAAINVLPPAVYLRGQFAAKDIPVRYATLFATALGAVDVHLNGQRINSSHLDPGWTDYHQRVLYRAYDVTARIRSGDNVLGAIVADGWYSGYIGWLHDRDIYGKHPRFLGQLHIEYVDGSTQIIATNPDWLATDQGPIRSADMLMGETYDARMEMPGWDDIAFDATTWRPVDVGSVPVTPVIEPHVGPPVVELTDEIHRARSISEPIPGVYVLDMGQNCAAIPRVKIKGMRGQKITLRTSERLNQDGALYRINLRGATSTDTYICRGDEGETWSPRFTYHGYQFIEITGLDRKPEPDTVMQVPISSDTPVAGKFECSDPKINQLASNIYWSQRSNFVDIPTDCPQRDERLGWTGDAQIFSHAAALRTDVQGFFTKWLVDLDDAQEANGLYPWVAPRVAAREDQAGAFWAGCSPAWADAGIICPWMLYEIYRDRRQLARHYPNMARYMDWMIGQSRPNLLPPDHYRCLGDWLNQDAETPHDVIRTAYFAHCADLLSRSAIVLEHSADATRYGRLAEAIKTAFRNAYVGQDGRIVGHTQTGYALAIVFDLLNDSQLHQAGGHLIADIQKRGWKPSTGFIGTKPLMLALSKLGRNDVAFKLLKNESFPSWMFSINNGATTIWERWDGWTPRQGFFDANMNSFNHYALGAVYQWMVENIGGIRPTSPGYQTIEIAPYPGELTYAEVVYESIAGKIASKWNRDQDLMKLNVMVPPNTRAVVVLPTSDSDSIRESGETLDKRPDIGYLGHQNHLARISIGSGSYSFEFRLAMNL